jgi:hypothetical protein
MALVIIRLLVYVVFAMCQQPPSQFFIGLVCIMVMDIASGIGGFFEGRRSHAISDGA